jgi:hypothetical protein
MGFVCSVFRLGLLIQSVRPLRPGQIFCGVVADLLSCVPGPSPGIFSARVGFLFARDFGLLFSRCVRGCFSCSGLLSVVHLCLACRENL